MEVQVLFFARARELAGAGAARVALAAGATTADLWATLLDQFPALAELAGAFVFSVNREFVPPAEAARLAAGDEVAVIPPISGG